MNCLAQTSSPALTGSQGKSVVRLATAAVARLSDAVMYASAKRLVTLSTSALLVNPRPALSGGKVAAIAVLTPSNAATVVRYSARLRRRRGDRPGVGAVPVHWAAGPP